jgi:hypothetical protein
MELGVFVRSGDAAAPEELLIAILLPALAAVLLVSTGCGDVPSEPSPLEPPLFINVQGLFVADSFDGAPPPVQIASGRCGTDTATLMLTYLGLEFLDSIEIAREWDEVRSLQSVQSWCGQELRSEGADTFDWLSRATEDSLFIRVINGPFDSIIGRFSWKTLDQSLTGQMLLGAQTRRTHLQRRDVP